MKKKVLSAVDDYIAKNPQVKDQIDFVRKLLAYGLVRNPAPIVDKLGFILPTSKGFFDLKRNKFIPCAKEGV